MAIETTNKGASAVPNDERENPNYQPGTLAKDQAAPKRPYPEDDVLTSSIYEVAKEVDRILNRCSVQDHAAILGMIQVTGGRRAHEYQERNQRKMQEAQDELQKRAAQQKFSVQ